MNPETKKRLDKLFSKPKLRILVVVRDHMSGLLYATPYLRALRQRFPGARIALLANPYATPILKGCPYVDDIVPFFQFRQEVGRFARAKVMQQQANAWTKLAGRVDLVVHFRYVGPKTLLFCETLGRPFQAGNDQGGYDHLLDLNLGPPDNTLGSRERNAYILESLGVPCPSDKMELWITPDEQEWAGNWLSSQGLSPGEPFMILHPGCHWGCNEWLPERWSELGDAILARYSGRIVITGTERERPLAQQIADGMKSPAIIAAGQTTLPGFAALIDRSRLVLSVDTAPTQICQALSVPAVILMGAGNPAWNGPLPGEPMVMLQRWNEAEEGTQRCDFAAGVCHGPFCQSRLMLIQVKMVLDAADSLLEEQLVIAQSDLN